MSNNHLFMNKIKDQNFHNSVQSSSDASDKQITSKAFYYDFQLLLPNNLLYGKMKAISLIVIFIFMCCFCQYTSVEIMPELKKNILNFGYKINFKNKGILSHSFDGFYVVT